MDTTARSELTDSQDRSGRQTLPHENLSGTQVPNATKTPSVTEKQWGLDFLDIGFEFPQRTVSTGTHKRGSSALKILPEVSETKQKQQRTLEFYETPLAKHLEARLFELSSKRSGTTPTSEVINLSDDDEPAKEFTGGEKDPPLMFPLSEQQVSRSKATTVHPRHKLQLLPDSTILFQAVDHISQGKDFTELDPANISFKHDLPESVFSKKRGNLIPYQKHDIKKMCHQTGSSYSIQKRTLSLQSPKGIPSQPSRLPNKEVIQSSRLLQDVIHQQEVNLAPQPSMHLPALSDGTLVSSEQQLSIALAHLAAEKTSLEHKLHLLCEEFHAKNTELSKLKQENEGLQSQTQKYKLAISAIKSRFFNAKDHMQVIAKELAELGEQSSYLRGMSSDCSKERRIIKDEIQKAYEDVNKIRDDIDNFRQSSFTLRSVELERDRGKKELVYFTIVLVILFRTDGIKAFETNEMLRTQLSDYAGELSLARDRVSTLETILEKATQSVVKEKEISADVANMLTEIKTSCNWGFGELQKSIESMLNSNHGVLAQTKNLEESMALLVKAEIAELTKKTNGLGFFMNAIKQEMRRSERRIRSAAVSGGFRAVGQIITSVEALENLFRTENSGVMRM